jgi:Leucine-rich repeat (LRR) protein
MTSDFSKITELSIIRENITRLDNEMLKKLAGTLRKLDLSFNHITRIENIECLTNLRELELPFN